MKRIFPGFPIRHPKLVLALIGLITVAAALQLPKIKIDTDPENMLPADEPVRVDPREGQGRVQPERLPRGRASWSTTAPSSRRRSCSASRPSPTRSATWTASSPTTSSRPTEVDDILPEAGGGIRVQTLMEERPRQRRGGAADPRRRSGRTRSCAASSPPTTARRWRSSFRSRARTSRWRWGSRSRPSSTRTTATRSTTSPACRWPQDTFGAAMFQQMAVSAPAAFLLIFLLMLFFFRQLAGRARRR